MLCFDSQKMMLVTEDNKPFTYVFEGTPTGNDWGVYGLGGSFTFPYLQGVYTSIEFDIISTHGGILHRAFDSSNSMLAGEYVAGTTHFIIDMTTKPLWDRFSVASIANGPEFVSTQVTNIKIHGYSS